MFYPQSFNLDLPKHTTEVFLFMAMLWITEWIQRDKEHGLQLQGIKKRSLRIFIYTCLILFIELTMGKSSEFIYFQF